MSQPEQSSQLVQKLKQELKRCQDQCRQAYVFLDEITKNLEASHQLIQDYDQLNHSQAAYIKKLEDEVNSKSQELANVEHEFEEFRRRIKTQENKNIQYKTALERCLSSNTKPEAYTEARKLLDGETEPAKRISKAEKKSSEEQPKPFPPIKLPQFAPLKPR